MTTDGADADERDGVPATDENDGDTTGDVTDTKLDDEPAATDESNDAEPTLSLERAAIIVCFAGTILGSTLPWISVPGTTVLGFRTYGLATITIAAVAGGVAYALEWNRWAMAAIFVAGLLVSAIALVFLPFGGIGPLVTLVSGLVLAFTGLVGYDKRG